MKRKKKQTKEEMFALAKSWLLESNRLYKEASYLLTKGKQAENQAYYYRSMANSYRIQSRRLNKIAYKIYPSRNSE